MSIVVNEAALTTLLASPLGPVGREIGLLGELVAVTARANASGGTTFGDGKVMNIKTGRLYAGIQAKPAEIEGEAAAVIGTDAVADDGFNYGAFHDIAGQGEGRGGGERPWLTEALREVFTL